MPLDLESVRRNFRQIAVPAFGAEGQERAAAASVVLVGEDEAIETVERYLIAAGVRAVRRLSPRPPDGLAWVEALRGATVVVRSGFDDDPMLRAAVRLGVPVVVLRGRNDGVDVIAFRQHGPCPHTSLEIAERKADPPSEDGAGAVLAGALGACEALWLIARPGEGPRARHLRLALGGPYEEPVSQEIPWSPECFICGGSAREAVMA